MDFFSNKEHQTFKDLLFHAGYFRARNNPHDERRQDTAETLNAFALDVGISMRTAQRYWKENKCPLIYMKYLYILNGHMGEIHPLWDGFGINAKSGHIFSNKIDNPKYEFKPKDLNSIFWLRERAHDYEKLQHSLEREKKHLKGLQKGELAKHIGTIEIAANKAAKEAINAILNIDQPNDVERGIETLNTTRRKNHY